MTFLIDIEGVYCISIMGWLPKGGATRQPKEMKASAIPNAFVRSSSSVYLNFFLKSGSSPDLRLVLAGVWGISGQLNIYHAVKSLFLKIEG